ncbi:alpha/beta hydrolase [Streptomyces aurantiacus]|uniref:alpha/beta hydrolase n=1 Tax=Streptomyces aurantiacus TaxID=47760 RepID=UPI0006E1B303|nr:alpha/beta hydrolase [Streptomyces aurantiacus]
MNNETNGTLTPRQIVEDLLRQSPLDLGGAVPEQREIYRQMMQGLPAPQEVSTERTTIGGVPVVTHTPVDASGGTVLLYLHGGGYTFGSANDSAALVCAIARPARATVVSVDYRLAPEHPYPAALDDVIQVYRALRGDHHDATLCMVGESAGGGLVLSTLLALKEQHLPQPAAAVVLSPWLDHTPDDRPPNENQDLLVTAETLRRRSRDYLGSPTALPTAADTLNADLSGLAPLHIQAGSSEFLLTDALRLADRAAAAHVPVELHVGARMQHVFQNFLGLLPEADAAVRAAGDFLAAHRPAQRTR